MENCLNKRRENMKTDIEIAQEAVMEPITNVAAGTKQNFLRNFWKKYKLVPMEN